MLGPSGHIDTFSRDNLPPAQDQPEMINVPAYPDWLNAGVELSDRLVQSGLGARTALWGANASCSYSELTLWSDRIAQVLTDDLGIVAGNRVLLFGGNTPALVACWIAVLKAGAVAVNVMPMLRAGELGQIIEKAQATHAICDARLRGELALCAAPASPLKRIICYDGTGETKAELDRLASAKTDVFKPVRTGRDDVALIAFTSGSTGVPKATAHFHRDLLTTADGYARDILNMTADDICIGTPPIAFAFGLGGLVTFPLRFGASTVLLDDLKPAALAGAIERYRATLCFTSPTAYRSVVASPSLPAALRTLRVAVSAGEPLPVDLHRQWAEASAIPILDGIGSTELLSYFVSNRIGATGVGTTGIPVDGYEAKIVDEHMRELPRKAPGRLAVKGPTGCRYLADDRQKEAVREGWNLTGDIFFQDDDGFFHFLARSDDIILSAGYNIAAPEVEAALFTHDAVRECAVVGISDPKRGHIVEAIVVLNPPWQPNAQTTERLQKHVKTAIAPYKYPRSVRYVSALPKTPSGKIQRYRLRANA